MVAAESGMGWGVSVKGGRTQFRLWAPGQENLRLRLGGDDHPMFRDEDGWFRAVMPAAAGAPYGFVLDDGRFVPDPASRGQAGAVDGPSLIVDPQAYRWRNADWRGRPWEDTVILELHVGTFTPEGTFRAAAERLGAVAEAGFTAIELMPLAQFAGARGWGYDGVLLYAPHRAYGTPDELRALVDAAHGQGLMVFLDVVYNHFGPEGNVVPALAPEFFRAGETTPWGDAIAYERPEVRCFFLDNAVYWLEDFRFDGLRLDAVDHVNDPDSPEEILVELAREVRARFPGRHVHLATEDNRNITRLHERDRAGRPRLHTAEWNDDFHNVAHVIATGETEGYYRDFVDDRWGKLARALAEGFVYQGEHSGLEGGPRGAPSGHLPPVAFVDFLQNHDQVGNRAFGERLSALAPPPLVEALTAVLLLSPHVPLMFMGEEWGETRPFSYFTDFHGALGDAVREGRRNEFRGFAAFHDAGGRAEIPDPNDEGTCLASKLDWARRRTPEGRARLRLVQDLLAVRASEIVPRLAGAPGHGGRVIAAEEGAIAVDWRLAGAVLRLRANLGDAPRALPVAVGRTVWGEAGGGLAPACSVRATIDAG